MPKNSLFYLSLSLFLTINVTQAQELQFGPQSSIQSGAQIVDDVALIVNNQALSRSQLNQEMAKYEAQIPPELAAQMSPEMRQRMILDGIIDRLLIKQATKDAAVKVTDAEINAAIAEVAGKNRLTPEQLMSKIAMETGMDAKAYRAAIAEQITMGQLQERIVGEQVRVSQQQIASQVAQIARQEGSSIHLQDLLLPLSDENPMERGKSLNKTYAEISAALKKSHNDLQSAAAAIPNARFNDLGTVNIGQIPQRFANAVINLQSGQITPEPVIDADGMHFLKVVDKTAEGAGKYVVVNARAAHILLKTNPKNPAMTKTQIDQIYAALKSGADFSKIAARYSQDPKSAVVGGDLGWVSADMVDPNFAKQMIEAPIGQITAPFETNFGWHILLVKERHNIDRSDAMLRAKIREQLAQMAMRDAWEKYLIELRKNAYIQLK
ncbi:MAG: peptidylprolyl isomerase [Cardiobacteriaceae bacterium]|nr:peptidylprolyl isomerase [Cardiobacteriaceae bacterium]